jgi:hypothetical protein
MMSLRQTTIPLTYLKKYVTALTLKNAPAYKLTQFIANLIPLHINLPYAFNVKNSIELIQDLQKIPTKLEVHFALVEIKNDTNIVISDLIKIIKE